MRFDKDTMVMLACVVAGGTLGATQSYRNPEIVAQEAVQTVKAIMKVVESEEDKEKKG